MIPAAAFEGIAARMQQESDRRESAAIEESAKHFEALLLRHLVQTLRETSLEDGFFGKSAGSGTLESMFESYLADALAEGAPLGLADSFEQLGTRNPAEAADAYEDAPIEALGALKWG